MARALRIHINGRNAFTISATPGDKLLDCLAESGIRLPSACGGYGSCGQCKILLLGRPRAYSRIESPWIPPSEQEKGVHLACQITVDEPLDLEVDPAYLGAPAQEVRLVEREELVPGIFRMLLELPQGRSLTSHAGQFIQLEMKSDDHAMPRQSRAYSIASAPGTSQRFEIEVQRIANGVFSGYLIDRLAVGEWLSFSGPFGGFDAVDSPRELICAAVGSGMAPIRSILLGIAQSGVRRRISYFFAARRASEIPHVEEMRALERHMAGFRFIPIVTDRSGEMWRGVSESMSEALERSVVHGSGIDACVCGNARFVDACFRVLTEKGVEPQAIHRDSFTQGGERVP